MESFLILKYSKYFFLKSNTNLEINTNLQLPKKDSKNSF